MQSRSAWTVPAGLVGPAISVAFMFAGDTDAGEFWLLMVLLAAGSAWGFYSGFKWWRWARLIEDTPTSRVRSAAQGYAELEGTSRLMGGEPILAPLSGRTCVWWRYVIEEYVDEGRRKRWRTVESAVSEHIFVLEDDTGSCVIDPDGAEVLPAARDAWYGGTPRPGAGPPPVRGFRGFGDRYRYRESRLDVDEPLYAIGWFRSDTGVDGRAPGDELAALLRDWKRRPRELLKRFDRNGDGLLSVEEWERARAEAHREVMADRNRRAAEPGVQILSAPEDGRPFLLAAGTADELARHYRLRAASGLALFVGATCAVAWSMLNLAP